MGSQVAACATPEARRVSLESGVRTEGYAPADLPSWMRTTAMTARAMPSQLRTPTFSFHRTTPGGAVDRVRGCATMGHDRIGSDKASHS